MPDETLEQIVKITLENWDGWPSPTWLIREVARKTRRDETDVSAALRALCERGVVARVQHGDEIVFRIEQTGLTGFFRIDRL